MFLDRIKFHIVYSDKLTRCYEPVNPIKPQGRKFRRVMFIDLGEEKEGVIVGKTSRYDGVYVPEGERAFNYSPEYEPAYFINEKRHTLWRVFTAINEEYLVPAKEPALVRVVTPKEAETMIRSYEDRVLLAGIDLS